MTRSRVAPEIMMAALGVKNIEASEAAGQRELVKDATRLPIESNAIVPRARVSELTGIVFGEPIDDLFVSVTLPNGWTIRPTEHAMWSDLVNDKGMTVATIFYKAAFYDRRARIEWYGWLGSRGGNERREA